MVVQKFALFSPLPSSLHALVLSIFTYPKHPGITVSFLALYGHFVLLCAKHCVELLDLKAPHLLANKPGILQTDPSTATDLDLQDCNFGHPDIHLLGYYILTCLDQDSFFLGGGF